MIYCFYIGILTEYFISSDFSAAPTQGILHYQETLYKGPFPSKLPTKEHSEIVKAAQPNLVLLVPCGHHIHFLWG